MTEEEQYGIQERINSDKNIENIYNMLHEFRRWNKDWDLYMKNKPMNADEFVQNLSKKYTINQK